MQGTKRESVRTGTTAPSRPHFSSNPSWHRAAGIAMSDPTSRPPMSPSVSPPFLSAPVAPRGRLSLVGQSISIRPAESLDPPASGAAWARRYRVRLLLSDALVVSTALTVALFARFGIDGASTPIGPLNTEYWVISLLIGATWLTSLGALRTRDGRVIGMGATEYKRVVNASAITFGLLAITFLILQVDIARSWLSRSVQSFSPWNGGYGASGSAGNAGSVITCPGYSSLDRATTLNTSSSRSARSLQSPTT